MDSMEAIPADDEAVIYRTKCHWAIFLGPALVIIIGGLALRSQGIHAMALMAFGLLWGVSSHVAYRGSELRLTRKRVAVTAGFLVLKSRDIPLGKISAVDFYQPSLGSMLGFGKITIVYEGQKRVVVRFVSTPAEFVTQVRQQVAQLG